MELQQQVCTLAQAKKFSELGVEKDAEWRWIYPANPKMISSSHGIYHYLQARDMIAENEDNEFDVASAPAYSVAELGEMFPPTILLPSKTWGKDEWITFIEAPVRFPTEAEARAALLIDLLERKVFEVEWKQEWEKKNNVHYTNQEL